MHHYQPDFNLTNYTCSISYLEPNVFVVYMKKNKTNEILDVNLWKVNMDLNYNDSERVQGIAVNLPILNNEDYKYISCEVIQVLNDNCNRSALICDYILINDETGKYQYFLTSIPTNIWDFSTSKLIIEYANLIEHEVKKINSTFFIYLIGCYSTEIYILVVNMIIN